MATKNKNKQIVRLRTKPLSNGNESLYLDIYLKGKRKYEFLNLYLVNSSNPLDKAHNKEVLALANKIRTQRELEIINNAHGFHSSFKLDASFIEYFELLTEERKESKGNYGNWDSTLKHLKYYCKKDPSFRDIDRSFVEGFKKYLSTTKKGEKHLSTNSQHSYFNKFRAALKKAFEDNLIPDNPAKGVKGIKPSTPEREYLTIEEVRKIAKTECNYPVLKRAFLFSCLTGLRWSDIQKLKWSEVRNENGNSRIIFRQKKTKGLEYLNINNQARELLGEEKEPIERVFEGLKYSAWHNIELKKWILKAGITKDITFHCGRHTFAVIQLELGTDIYTVSKLLGHTELKTTQVYAKIIDQKKVEAVNKFPDIQL